MKLTRFRVQNFRSFVDSGWVVCDNVTAIAGVNEAGKSNLLRALWKLNPAFKSDNKILRNDVPIDRFDEIMDGEHMPIFITAEFRLRPLDKEEITKKFGPIDFSNVRVSRYLSGEYLVEYPVTIPDAIKKKLDDFIIKIMPGFVYYSNYGNLDSNIYLPQMLAKFNKNGVNTISKSKQRTIKLLLLYIGITPEMLVCDADLLSGASSASNLKLTSSKLKELTEKNERYQKLFKEAGKKLTREFNQWWHQGEYSFEFAFDAGNLTIFVTDKNGIRAPLDDRSMGIQWFLSFFLVFSLESQIFYSNTIMLLDESGTTLHGLAQQDLVHFFDELAKTNQIIYSTHSSFMLPAEHLNRTRVVYKDSKGHSLVSSDMTFREKTHSSEAAIVPVSTSINMQLSATILKDGTPIIVMDNAVEVYLNLFKNYLLENGELNSKLLKKPLIIIPSSPSATEGMAQIFARQKVLPYVLVEESLETYKVAEKLKSTYGELSNKILVLKDIFRAGSIEDLIPQELLYESAKDYLEAVFGNGFKINVNIPVLEQVESLAKTYQLPSDFRERLANNFASFVMANLKDKRIKTASKTWLKLFDYIAD